MAKGKLSNGRWLIPPISLLAGAVVWEWIGNSMAPGFWAPLSTTFERLVEMIGTGELPTALTSSLLLFLSGFGLAVAFGAAFGLLLARMQYLREAVEVYILVLYVTPMVALVPFILSMLGFGFGPKVLVVFLFAVFPVLYNTVEGGRALGEDMMEVARSFRTDERAFWIHVLLPHTVPYIMTGVRQGIGRGLIGMVAAELLLSASGVGGLILRSSQDFDIAGVLAGLLVISVLGVLLMEVGRLLENRFAAWRGLER